MSSVLESEYVKPVRPYSQDELKDRRQLLRKTLYLGNTVAYHSRCGHFYLLKRNSKREKEIKATGTLDTGNCTVCWKLHHTPRLLRKNARNLVKNYCYVFNEETIKPNSKHYISYEMAEIESAYYQWLSENIKTTTSKTNNS
jgi:cob(I)alamin adenosyltransferase